MEHNWKESINLFKIIKTLLQLRQSDYLLFLLHSSETIIHNLIC
jgi:hypothetical protein